MPEKFVDKLAEEPHVAVASGIITQPLGNGVTIVAIPKVGSTLSNVRDDAQRIESTMRQRAAAGAASTPSGEACGLFHVLEGCA